MNDAHLMRRVIEYGADEGGINDRFMGNAELYVGCLRDFIDEPNFDALADAMQRRDRAAAFDAAHALKGLSGNLGVTAFYGAACALVEHLRAGSVDGADALYDAVCAERDRLRRLIDEEDGDGEAPAEPAKDAPSIESKLKRKDRLVFSAALALLATLALVAAMLVIVVRDHSDNVTRGSAAHLLEINQQVRLYIEERIANDWRVATSVGDSIADSNFVDDDAAIFDMLCKKRDVWGVSDIILYTEDGGSIRANGQRETVDFAMEMIAGARRESAHLAAMESSLIYTVPVDTHLRYGGARIAAVSVVQDMGSFLDSMEFSSFGGKAWMYLTDDEGAVVSMLTVPGSEWVDNISALYAGERLETLTGDTDDPFTGENPSVYLADEKDDRYIVCMPIKTGDDPMRLYYIAPTDVVNGIMNDFSQRLVLLCILVILGFTLAGVMVFASVYIGRRRLFDQEMQARERLFELLTRNTQTSFALFTVNRERPDYISGNSKRIVGDASLFLLRKDDVYSIQSATGLNSDTIRRLNDAMRGWDGQSVFKSGAILNDQNNPPTYFTVELYPAEGERYVGIAQDATQATKRENTARDALAMAERANDAKSRFLSNMSHDIRTPMNAIVNMTGFAIESVNEPKKLTAYLRTIRESSDHLLRLINDVLDVSRIESGQMAVSDEPFDLRAELQRQADMIRPLCDEKQLTLTTDFGGVTVQAVRGDQLKLSQILMNLLGNAVKFTPENGAVRFAACEIPSLREEIVDVRFIIEDDGIGIEPETIAHIFEPFTRADDKRVSQIEGTGLGLSICHSYVLAMGGSMQCESEPGKGSAFTVELFFQRAQALPQETVDASALGDKPFLGMRCLVAEDNNVNQLIARRMLERVGFAVEIVADGAECLSAFVASKPGTYNAIYMDIQMPVMDGYQAAAAIRAADHPDAKTVPMIAMTANVFTEDIEKARYAGMDGHLGKPLTTRSLIEETYRVQHGQGR